MHYYSPFLTETTFARYINARGDNTTCNPYNLSFHVGPDGKSYIYNSNKLEFISEFLLGFKGCFKYGRTYYFTRKDCHMGHVTDIGSGIFYKELRIQPPKFKVQENFYGEYTSTDLSLCGIYSLEFEPFVACTHYEI